MQKIRFLKRVQIFQFSNQLQQGVANTNQTTQLRPDNFTKLINFDSEQLRQIPKPIKFIEPAVIQAQETIISFMNYTGCSLPLTIFIVALAIRASVLPLMLFVQKKLAKLADKYGFFQLIKQTYDSAQLPKTTKLKSMLKLGYLTTKELKLNPIRILLMNISHFPFLLFTIYGLRRVIATKGMEDLSFFWVASPIQSDPYYILPFLACSIYYYNFGKGINPNNENTFFGKFRRIFQLFMILWFPLLSQWPSAIQFYILSNALITLAQSSLFATPYFIAKMNPKLLISFSIMQRSQISAKSYQNLMQSFCPNFEIPKITHEELMFNLSQEKKLYKKTLKDQKINLTKKEQKRINQFNYQNQKLDTII